MTADSAHTFSHKGTYSTNMQMLTGLNSLTEEREKEELSVMRENKILAAFC